MRSVALAVAVAMLSSGGSGAELSTTELTSYRDMHRETDYGTWFVNIGAFRSGDFRDIRSFREIVGSGEIGEVPRQRGYCFVMNNFDPGRTGEQETLDISLTKRGELPTAGAPVSEAVEKMSTISFRVTSEMVSRNPPRFCISALTGVKTLQIAIDASNNAADRNFTIKVNH